jgi:hypothetical protein
MPEERTVSRFTRIDSTDRASQDASTIVAQTMIYQNLRRQARAAGESVCYQLLRYQVRIQLNFTKPPHASKPPSLNWRSVKTLFVPVAVPQDSVSSPIIISDSEILGPLFHLHPNVRRD